MNLARLRSLAIPLFAFALSWPVARCGFAQPPRWPEVLDPQLKLELFACEPDIVTPVGATVDRRGRLLVIESHTHQRPADYRGPETDRIRIVEDTDGNGRADRFRTFFEGTSATMSIRRGPGDWIYVATRMKIFRVRDTDGDDRADERQNLVELETDGNYPHNGLSGLAFDAAGNLYFGMGENLGADYRMKGADGATQRGSGEGGVFRCDARGRHLVRIATGFWNPFGICVDRHGRIFAVGNDADGRPPSRLVQIVETGDYGFQYRYGRSGKHPLQAWDGELPGTLPMVTGTGEAPCEIVPWQGRLYVGSWGDFRVERYRLIPVGASFHASREVVVQGDEQFRPVAFAEAADGSLFFTDWVDKSYPVHGKGRIWRLSRPAGDQNDADTVPLSGPERRARQASLRADPEALRSADVFLRQAAVAGLVRSGSLADFQPQSFPDARQRLGGWQALRWQLDHSRAEPIMPETEMLRQALADRDVAVRLFAVRWIADAGQKPLREEVLRQLEEFENTTPELFQATIATLEILDTGQTTFDPANTSRYFSQIVRDPRQAASLRALALSMLPADDESLDREFLAGLVDGDSLELAGEAVRSLAVSQRDHRRDLLNEIARRQTLPASIRADAVAGLALTEASAERTRMLGGLASLPGAVGQAARRARRPATAPLEHPSADDEETWMERVGEGGDPEAGWRVFHGAGKLACARCHRLRGRGEKTGPDLTGIVARTSRRGVLRSILKPDSEMAPHFIPSLIETVDGEIREGLWQGYDAAGKQEVFLSADGTVFRLDPADIQARRMSAKSIMPDDLYRYLTVAEIRDLLALLGEE